MSPLAAALVAVALNHGLFAAVAFPLWLWAAWLGFAVACLARGRMALAAAGPAGRPTALAAALGALAVAPAALPLAVSWDREFGFGGDASFHIGAAFRLALWWASAPFSAPAGIFDPGALDALRAEPWRLGVSRAALLGAGLALAYIAHRKAPRATLALAAVALLAWGAVESAREFRYPALAYHATFPFLVPAVLAGAPELAFRLSNLAAVVTWLFVLRPWLLKRWPDPPALAVAALLFWNDAFLAILDAAYLETWAIVFLALAVEARARGGADAAPLACVLVGFAAAVKEPAIFVLPFIWFSALPWRDVRGRGLDATLAAFAAGLPFLSFFVANRTLGQVRPVSFGAPDATTLAGLAEYAERFAQSGGGWALAGLALAVGASLRWRNRAGAAACLGAGIFLVLFFSIERSSLGYAGLPRFMWMAMPVVAAGLFALEGRARSLAALALCVAQAPGAAAAVERARADFAARGFVNYYDAPFVFPIKALVREAGFAPGTVVTVVRPDAAIQAGAAMGRQGAILDFVDEAPCACTAERPAFMALAPPATGFWAGGAMPPPGTGPELQRIARWRAAHEALPACREALEASCARVLTRSVGGLPVAALGFGPASR
ncbi:MAG: hypothetical protein ACKO1J_17505 [Tagaea sp.]